jgi:diguanylate cyclase (GGDEF)-like protein
VGVAHVPSIFERLARQYAYQAWHDPLTKLPNRQYLMDQIELREEPRTSAGGDWHEVFFYIDLDRFKDVNDHLGHAAGDQVLVQFADRLCACARPGDVVVRLGGDEFAILTADLLTVEQSTAFAEQLVREAASPFVVTVTDVLGAVTEQVVTIGASVGVARSDRSRPSLAVTSLEVLLKQADLAMYRAKEHGRGRAAQYEPQMGARLGSTEELRERRAMERRLRKAIEQGGLTIHYQPVVDLPSGRVSGVEALVRWDDPALGRVPADEFVVLAEATGLILDLGEWVLRTACGELSALRLPDGGPELTLAVNVSPIQLAAPGFVEVVDRALADSGLPGHRLCLEITETAAIADLRQTTVLLSELRRLGVQIALDDFGTGHSSLTMLRTLPVTIIKIDRSFVEDIAHSTKDATLVRLVIETAHTLGLKVCAEGVEDSDQAQKLVAMGCDTAQGWFFSRPEPSGIRLSRALSRLADTTAPLS